MRKSWVDMDREELLDEKALWESKLQKLNLELAVTRRQGAAGNFADAATYEGLLTERLRLTSGLRGVSAQLSKVNAARRASVGDHQLDQAFRKVAKLILEVDLYEDILEGARDILRSS